ncbi:MAG: hypothetical protein VKJ87_02985 [Synechococcus sp.]|nr:hypothetical protein [Synechococcus sp.]
MQPLRIGIVVALISAAAVLGPSLGLSPAWITVAVMGTLVFVSVDAAVWSGRGGHLLAEALPGGRERLRRIALHEAGHRLVACSEGLEPGPSLVGTLACLRAGRQACGSTELPLPASSKLPLEELRRWSRVLLAGMAAEVVVHGESEGGADDCQLLGRLWGLSGHPAATAQLEQRRARREVEQWLRQQRPALDQECETLLANAPSLRRLSVPAAADVV